MRKDRMLESLRNRLNVNLAMSKQANIEVELTQDERKKQEARIEQARRWGRCEAYQEMIKEIEKL